MVIVGTHLDSKSLLLDIFNGQTHFGLCALTLQPTVFNESNSPNLILWSKMKISRILQVNFKISINFPVCL